MNGKDEVSISFPLMIPIMAGQSEVDGILRPGIEFLMVSDLEHTLSQPNG